MRNEPYRSSVEPAAERERARRVAGDAPLDGLMRGALGFIFACSAARACVALRDRAVDDDLVLALLACAATAWGLVSSWVRRKRGD